MTRPAIRTHTIESLECRRLAVGLQDAVELWWKFNLLRSQAYDGLQRLAISTPPLPRQHLAPLAWNKNLQTSSELHALEMSQHNYFSHQSPIDGRWPNQMVRDQNYPLPQSLPADRNDVETLFAGAEFDEVDSVIIDLLGNESTRSQLFASGEQSNLRTEMGIGVASNPESTFDHYWSLHIAGRQQGERFISGVAYADLNGNRNYDAGEGLPNIQVVTGELSATSDANGVYSIPVAGGRHIVTFLGSDNSELAKAMFSIGERSIALDFRVNDSAIETNFRTRSWWTNADNHVDVNRDRFVNSIDALVVINQLNRGGVQSLGTAAANQSYPTTALDTNGDQYVNAMDALVVINYLNRG